LQQSYGELITVCWLLATGLSIVYLCEVSNSCHICSSEHTKNRGLLYFNLNWNGRFSPEWSLFNFALTKWDFRLQFFLNVRRGRGSSVFLKHLVLCISCQWFLITPMTLWATIENLVIKASLLEFPTLCLGFSS